MSRTRGGRRDRTRATILTRTDTLTELGGRATVWGEAGVVWFAVDTRGLRERPAEDARALGAPRLVETARVACRTHPAAVRGVRLSTREGDWAVTAVEADTPAPGRAILHLRRV